jgi:hypothetical protein
MLLPHFKSPNININNPIYSNLFNVNFICKELTTNECDYLIDNINKIQNQQIYFNFNENKDGGILIMRILKKIKGFNINITINNKNNVILGILIFYKCNFKNINSDLCDFKYFNDILNPGFNFKYLTSEYIDYKDIENYKRIKKIERIIKKPLKITYINLYISINFVIIS